MVVGRLDTHFPYDAIGSSPGIKASNWQWIGYQFKNGELTAEDWTPVSYENWITGADKRGCVYLEQNGKWNGYWCHVPDTSVCKWQPQR